MKKLHKVQMIAVAFIMAIVMAAPIALAQSSAAGEAGKEQRVKRHAFGMHRGHRGARGMRRVMSQLDLTDAQKEQIKQIRSNHSENIRPLAQQIRSLRQELHQSLQGGSFDQAIVNQKMTEIAGLKTKLMAEKFQIHQEMLTVLTPEQKAKLEQLREQRKSKREQRKSEREQRRAQKNQSSL